METFHNIVDGKPVAAADGRTLDIVDPSTGEVYATSPNHSRAIRMSRALEFGCVWINTHIPLVAEMPHGGFKESGYGKDLSQYSLEDYTRIKHVMSAVTER